MIKSPFETVPASAQYGRGRLQVNLHAAGRGQRPLSAFGRRRRRPLAAAGAGVEEARQTRLAGRQRRCRAPQPAGPQLGAAAAAAAAAAARWRPRRVPNVPHFGR